MAVSPVLVAVTVVLRPVGGLLQLRILPCIGLASRAALPFETLINL
jgi:hypothetical protein